MYRMYSNRVLRLLPNTKEFEFMKEYSMLVLLLIRFSVVSCGFVFAWFVMVWYGLIWSGMVWFGFPALFLIYEPLERNNL
jgi:hypothetical protein